MQLQLGRLNESVILMTDYYHITLIENLDSILANGLSANSEMQIFVCTSLEQLPKIAGQQVFINEYSVFKIDPKGIEATPTHDDVAETGNEFQFIINQPLIKPEYIEHVKDERWHRFDLAEYNHRLSFKHIGVDEKEVVKHLEEVVSHNKEWCEYYNNKHGKNIRPQA